MVMELAGSSETLVHIYKTIQVCHHIAGNYNLTFTVEIHDYLECYMVHSCSQFSLGVGLGFLRNDDVRHRAPITSGLGQTHTFSQWWITRVRWHSCVSTRKFLYHMNCREFVCILIEQVVDWLRGKHSAPPIGIYFASCIFSRDYLVFVNARKYSDDSV
jgi:hypothetical protein